MKKNITNILGTLKKLDKNTLHDLLYYYNAYIQEANDFNKYADGWYPVCIEEFYQNDYEVWKKNSECY